MRILALAAIIGLIAAPALAAPPAVTGRWLTPNGKALVEIAPCGQALCGHIVRILKPAPGRPQTDVNNPDPTKRSQPLAGLTLLSEFKATSDSWEGKIYDPQSGRTYRSILTRDGNTLNVKGCWGVFCKTQQWTRTN